MHGFSTADGFVEITEDLSEMIKYVANEPSVGLFYVQQHTQSAVPNVISLKNNIEEKSRETALHTQDLEDSIAMARSMKECGFPIADEMIKDIKKSLVIMSTKQPRRGLIRNQSSGFDIGRSSSWGPASWGRSVVYAQKDGEKKSNYLSTVFQSAKQKASNFKWAQLESKESVQIQGEKSVSYPTSPLVPSASTSSTLLDMEADELPLSSPVADVSREEGKEQPDISLSPYNLQLEDEKKRPNDPMPPHNSLSVSENYEDFKADREAKLRKWLEESGGNLNDYTVKRDAEVL